MRAVSRSRTGLVGLLVAWLVLLPQIPAVAAVLRAPARVRVAITRPWPVGPRSSASPVSIPGPSVQGSCFELPREVRDRPDLTNEPTVHVLYLVAKDFRDEGLDIDGTLDCSIRALDEWFARQSEGWRWRFDTFMTKVTDPASDRRIPYEAIDVTYVESDKLGSELNTADAVFRELQRMGFFESDKRYLSFVAAGSDTRCGDAFLGSVSPIGPADGQFAQVYLYSSPACRAHEFGVPGAARGAEAIALQELLHNDGAVPVSAPHHCAQATFHVCTAGLFLTEGGLDLDPERYDVMFPYAGIPLWQKALDIGHDDYFGHLYPVRDLDESPYLFRTS